MRGSKLGRAAQAVFASLACLAGIALPVAGPAPLASATPTPGPTPSATTTSETATSEPASQPSSTADPDQPLLVRITSVGEPVLGRKSDIRVSAQVQNNTHGSLHLAQAALYSERTTSSNAEAITGFMSGDVTSMGLLATEEPDLTLEPGQTTNVNFVVSRNLVHWGSNGVWGPRGIQVSAVAGDAQGWDRSMLVVDADHDLERAKANVVVPLTAQGHQATELPTLKDTIRAAVAARGQDKPTEVPPAASAQAEGSTTTPSAGQDSAAAGPNGQAAAGQNGQDSATQNGQAPTLFELSGPSDPVAEALTAPAQIEALQKLGRPGVTAAVDPALRESAQFSEALAGFTQNSGASVAYLPGGDVDIASIAHSTAGYQILEQGIAYAQAAAESDIAGTADIAFLARGADQSSLRAARTAGYSTAVISSADASSAGWVTPGAAVRIPLENTATSGSGGAPGAGSAATSPTTPDEASALIADDALSSAVVGKLPALRATEDDEAEAALDALDSRQVTLAFSALRSRERPAADRSQLLRFDRAWTAPAQLSAGEVGANIDALMAAPWISASSLDGLRATQTDYTAQLRENNPLPGEAIRQQLTGAETSLTKISSIARITSAPSLLINPATQRALLASSVGLREHPELRESLLADLSQTASSFEGAVSIQPSSPINVISENTELPVHVRNDLPMPIGVVIRVSAPDYRIRPEPEVAATIPASTTSTVSVPIRASGSGNIEILARVTDPPGSLVSRPQSIHVRVRAGWETTATTAAAIVFGLILVLGLVRSVRRGRRSKTVGPREHMTNIQADRQRRRLRRDRGPAPRH